MALPSSKQFFLMEAQVAQFIAFLAQQLRVVVNFWAVDLAVQHDHCKTKASQLAAGEGLAGFEYRFAPEAQSCQMTAHLQLSGFACAIGSGDHQPLSAAHCVGKGL